MSNPDLLRATKNQVVVVSTSDTRVNPDVITCGKLYIATQVAYPSSLWRVTLDDGYSHFIRLKNCAHILNGDWTVHKFNGKTSLPSGFKKRWKK